MEMNSRQSINRMNNNLLSLKPNLSFASYEYIGEEMAIRKYLESKKKLFLFLGISEIVEAILSAIVWAAHTMEYNQNVFLLPSLGSLVIIVTASFAITMGCKPQKWLCGTNMRLGIFSAVAGLSGMLVGIIEIVFGNKVLGSLLIVIQFMMFVSFLTQAVIAGYALKCCVCCSYDQEEILSEVFGGSAVWENPSANPYETDGRIASVTTLSTVSTTAELTPTYQHLPGMVTDY
ncbi:uncharacterized protein LOC120332722 [Styela clava]|uniref:uncharacterized protein LOC120332722 n=1 Tax=Styela clava TaxID=7725 RepID=UPI00193A7B04|nr:uncharacterized protein LOC120332722 [Styela clava]XP_039255966.1 uncharacterized protein LOC120332722 [Styela clava]